MIVEGAGLGELVLTDLAAVRSLPAVGPAVSPEGGDVRETPPTPGTGMGLLSSVSPQVELQVGFPRKLFITFPDITLEWFLACVHPHMLLKFGFFAKDSLTLLALERLYGGLFVGDRRQVFFVFVMNTGSVFLQV